jgi:hypothetical protein
MPTPEEILMAQQMGMLAAPSGESAQSQPALVPMQIGGIGAFANPTTGAITAPDVTSTTTKAPTASETKVPRTPDIAAASDKLAGAEGQALAAQDRKTSQAIQEETFRAEQKDREAQQAKAQLAEVQAANKAADDRLAEATQQVRARQEEYRNFKPTSYVEDMGTLRRVLSAIGMGLGHYSSAMTGAPNTAYQIYANQENAHREKQKAIAEKKAQDIEMATGDVNVANEFRKRTLTAINDRYLATNAYLQRQIDAKVARIPKAAADGEATKAALARDYGKAELEQANLLAGHRTTQEEEKSTTVVEGKGAGETGRARLPGQRDLEGAATAEIMDEKATWLDKHPEAAPTPEQVTAVHNNEMQYLARIHAESKSTWANIEGQIARGLDIFPSSIYPPDMKQDTRTWIRHQRDLWHAEAVALYEHGWLANPDIYQAVAEARAPKMGDTQQDIVEKGKFTSKQAHIFQQLQREAGKVWRQVEKREAERGAPAATTEEQIKTRNRAEARKIEKANPVPPRDFAQERKDILRARAILKDPKSTPAQRAAAERFQVQMGSE